jgi:hypothetical protein
MELLIKTKTIMRKIKKIKILKTQYGICQTKIKYNNPRLKSQQNIKLNFKIE